MSQFLRARQRLHNVLNFERLTSSRTRPTFAYAMVSAQSGQPVRVAHPSSHLGSQPWGGRNAAQGGRILIRAGRRSHVLVRVSRLVPAFVSSLALTVFGSSSNAQLLDCNARFGGGYFKGQMICAGPNPSNNALEALDNLLGLSRDYAVDTTFPELGGVLSTSGSYGQGDPIFSQVQEFLKNPAEVRTKLSEIFAQVDNKAMAIIRGVLDGQQALDLSSPERIRQTVVDSAPVRGALAEGAAENTRLAKSSIETATRVASSRRIADQHTNDKSPDDLAKSVTDKDTGVAPRLIQEADTAVSSRAAMQVIAKGIANLMEVNVNSNLQIVRALSLQMQQAALTTEQLSVIANKAIADQNEEVVAQQLRVLEAEGQASAYADQGATMGNDLSEAINRTVDTKAIASKFAASGW